MEDVEGGAPEIILQRPGGTRPTHRLALKQEIHRGSQPERACIWIHLGCEPVC